MFMWDIKANSLNQKNERRVKNLQENNIDVSHFVVWPKDHCQQAEYLTEGISALKH
jgi:hypothetical protein